MGRNKTLVTMSLNYLWPIGMYPWVGYCVRLQAFSYRSTCAWLLVFNFQFVFVWVCVCFSVSICPSVSVWPVGLGFLSAMLSVSICLQVGLFLCVLPFLYVFLSMSLGLGARCEIVYAWKGREKRSSWANTSWSQKIDGGPISRLY